jgi:signal transduction histidine kinase
MERSFLMVSIISIAVALVISVGMSRSLVKPVHKLIDATVKIAEGDMSKAVAFGGTDEIGMLSSSFEVMRIKLADSLEELHNYNLELEKKVADRTQQISDNRKKIKDLLRKVITTQEEERKRIAREFHDVIMQDLAASLIQIDLIRQYPQNLTTEKIDEIKKIIEKNIDDVYRIIKNLRPTILDDLGFEAAVRWLLDHHLETKGINCFVTIKNSIDNLNFDPQVEIELFRIIQESIINIAKHSRAENVFVVMESKGDNFFVDIEDDGLGFDTASVFQDRDSTRGLGLMGMKERASFLNWDLKIYSGPGEGTRVSLKVSPENEVNDHV